MNPNQVVEVQIPHTIADMPRLSPATVEPIAIIGAHGRFPESRDLDEFWQNLIEGRDLVSEIPSERWNWRDYQSRGPNGQSVVRWGGFMPDIDKFDAAFFGISSAEAALMDPQHRIFLESVWKTLEDGGYCPSAQAGRRIGVFVGSQLDEYRQFLGDAGHANPQAVQGNSRTMLANRVSQWFDFHGPSQTVDTACSSALVAVHRAARALQNGDCEMAIAGAVSAILSPETYILSQHLGMLSPDGRCKTFDRSADGYVKGEGVGAVLLKPLRRAMEEGDGIHAVILATAENHGGRSNFLTAPNPEAQAELIKTAHARAGIDPSTISYVEAHGTGTELGDPIEVDALKSAFRESSEETGRRLPEREFCGLGTVKSNIGHLEPAAGIAGLLKTVLALRHRRIPPTLHVREVNPYLRLAGSPFYLVTTAQPWNPVDGDGRPIARRAGVSSFGFGGSNAHVVLEESPAAPASDSAPLPTVVPLSAKDDARLRAAVENLCAFLRSRPAGSAGAPAWRDLVYTLQIGREAMQERLAVEAASPAELLAKLTSWLAGNETPGVFRGTAPADGPALSIFDTREEFDAFLRAKAANARFDVIAQLWSEGADVDWRLLYPGVTPKRVSLPTYPFARTRHWFAPPAPFPTAPDPPPITAAPVAAAPVAAAPVSPPVAPLLDHLRRILGDLLYLDPALIEDDTGFLDLGLDSILAVEFVKKINDTFGVALKATRLYDCPNLVELARQVGHADAGEMTAAPAPPTAAPACPPAPPIPAPAADAAADLPNRDVEAIRIALTELLAEALYLEPSQIDEDADFNELGLDSILAVELAKRIKDRLGVDVRATRMYDYSNLRKFSEFLAGAAPSPEPAPAQSPQRLPAAAIEANVARTAEGPSPATAPAAIAIIGLAGRFPGGPTPEEFWNRLANGDDLVTDIPVERWPRQYRDDPQLLASLRCRCGGFLDNVDRFDPLFFNISPREADVMDPQHRLFLEEAWKALEDAGYSDSSLSNRKCAVFVGAGGGDYFLHSLGSLSGPSAQSGTGNVPSILAGRLAYLLNLKGPAVAVDTACSSSLVAIHLACQSMWMGECEMAVAGGVSLMTTPQTHVITGESGMLSAAGRCRTFDDSADGFVPAEGVGAVVLKPLAAAMRDGDRIYAVIRGSGINQDGRTNGITAPSAAAQTELELAVYERFGIDPDTISYVEAHGTGTRLGDPIEVEALTAAMRRHTARRGFCAIGSVKSNMGHALAASGMAALAKVLLAFRHGRIPPSLHCERENAEIDFAASPFFVCRELRDWPAANGEPRRAAISSFGFSGTNAHMVLEEAPRVSRPVPQTRPAYLFTLSAKTDAALARRLSDLEAWLERSGSSERLEDISFTLNVGRSHFRRRVAVVAASREELRTKLGSALRRETACGVFYGRPRQQAAAANGAGPLERIAEAYAAGGAIDWSASNPAGSGFRISLPSYPFEAKRYWIGQDREKAKPPSEGEELLSLVGVDPGGPASFWIPSVTGEIHWVARLSHSVRDRVACFAFRRNPSEAQVYDSMEHMATAYLEALRQARPHGPYILGGYSYGGVLAFEMARQLFRAGEQVSHLVLLDSFAPGCQVLDWLLSVPWGDFVLLNIANLLTAQWKGVADLDASLFDQKDEDAQFEIAARQLKARCNLPHSEAELAGLLREILRAVRFERRLMTAYRAQHCEGNMRTLLFRAGGGFAGQSNELSVPHQFRGVAEMDHGWTAWLPKPPEVVEIAAADHFTIGREPALGLMAPHLADFLSPVESRSIASAG